MISFDEIFDTVPDEGKLSIFLGNGFSQAWSSEIFNYAQLFSVAEFGERHQEITSIFTSLGTYDFEKVMNSLISAETILSLYEPNNPLISTIKADQEILKNALITAISDRHPTLPREVTDASYVFARGFLAKFSDIFTLNYDLLVYWAINKVQLAPRDYNVDDGFRVGQKWVGYRTDQALHCLHGGIYIYEENGSVRKHACTESGSTIIDQVRNNLRDNKFPLFVSEPTSQKKKEKIQTNPYLYYCFRKIRELKGTVFIHGHSFDHNDRHIFTELDSSPVDKVYISIFGDEYSEANRSVIGNARAFLNKQGRTIDFYQAETAPIWKDNP